MKETVFDSTVYSCAALGQTIPMLARFGKALQEVAPAVHYWPGAPLDLTVDPGLPNRPIVWPDPYFCLGGDGILFYTNYQLPIIASDVDLGAVFWIAGRLWYLRGVMVFALDGNNFDVVPLVQTTGRGSEFVFPDVQLRFARGDDGWTWYLAKTGPVNHFFYRPLLRDAHTDCLALFDDAVNHTGRLIDTYLGAYLQHISQVGEWYKKEGKPMRAKIKAGKVKKVYEIAKMGYKQFVPVEVTNAS